MTSPFQTRLLLSLALKVTLEKGFIESKFREGKNPDGSFSFLRGTDRIKPIHGMQVLNVVTGEIEEL